jgi:anti-anti-sigma factor
VQELRSRYDDHLRKGGQPEVVIDMSGVGFAGSASLGNFVALHRQARQRGGRLIFCNVEPTVTEVFRASKLEPLFQFVADRAAAVSLITSGPIASSADVKTGGIRPSDQSRPGPGGLAGSSRLRRRKPESDPQ